MSEIGDQVLAELEAIYGELYLYREPKRMRITDAELTLAVWTKRQIDAMRADLESRVYVKKCPTGYADGGEAVATFGGPGEYEPCW